MTVSVPAMPAAAGGSAREPFAFIEADVSTALLAEFKFVTSDPAAVEASETGSCDGLEMPTLMFPAEIGSVLTMG